MAFPLARGERMCMHGPQRVWMQDRLGRGPQSAETQQFDGTSLLSSVPALVHVLFASDFIRKKPQLIMVNGRETESAHGYFIRAFTLKILMCSGIRCHGNPESQVVNKSLCSCFLRKSYGLRKWVVQTTVRPTF